MEKNNLSTSGNVDVQYNNPPVNELIPIQPEKTSISILNHLAKINEYAKILLRSGMLPEHIKKPEQVIAIIAKGRELGIPEIQALSSISIVKGVPIISGQLMMALIHRSGLLEDIKIEYDKDDTCIVTMKRKGLSPFTVSFGQEDAIQLGLDKKDNYIKQRKTMFMWRAITKNARITFPDVIGGCYIPEEIDMDGEYIPYNEIKDGGNFNFDIETYERIKIEMESATTVADLKNVAVKNTEEIELLPDDLKSKLRTLYDDLKNKILNNNNINKK